MKNKLQLGSTVGSHTFIIPQSRERLTGGSSRSRRIIEERTIHIHLQPPQPRGKDHPDGVVVHGVAVPGVLDGELHLWQRSAKRERSEVRQWVVRTHSATHLQRFTAK